MECKIRRAALVQSSAEATRSGKSALLVASRNDDVRVMNELAREAVRERLGDEHAYVTDFGERAFAINDVLVGRERAHGGVNGESYTLVAHRDDGRLGRRRQRDGAGVVWDLHEHRAIDGGYATTLYRSQGRTVDAVFALASSRLIRQLPLRLSRPECAETSVPSNHGQDRIAGDRRFIPPCSATSRITRV